MLLELLSPDLAHAGEDPEVYASYGNTIDNSAIYTMNIAEQLEILDALGASSLQVSRPLDAASTIQCSLQSSVHLLPQHAYNGSRTLRPSVAA